jgi:predicted nucleic acid-binding Zn finger protein
MITNETAARAQEARITRAGAQGSEMTWTKTAGGWTVQTASGGRYLVGAAGCSCPDYRFRCAGTKRRCKHEIALALHLVQQGLR